MQDWNVSNAVRMASPALPWTWVTWGTSGGPSGEPDMRVCPACAALVLNEDSLLQIHMATHRAQGLQV